ncbi:MAG: hypothetical protein ACOYJZ_00410 [Acutalibacter sp.]|jgi:hypothetical protein
MPGAFWQPQKNGPFFQVTNPIFSSKKGRIVFFSLLGVIAAALVVVYATTPKRGDTSLWSPVITMSPGAVDPSSTQVSNAMILVEMDFKKNFRNCSLGQVTYDQEASSAVSQDLKNRYKDQKLPGTPFVFIGDFSTGNGKLPQGLEEDQFYQDYQWVFVAAAGDNSQIPVLLDQGFGLVEVPEETGTTSEERTLLM